MTVILRVLVLAAFFLVTPRWAPGQALSVLHVAVVLVDAGQRPAPVPRHALLVSDEPPTASPRRIVTAMDGTVDVKLRPGTYVVESDQPVALNGKAYQWRQVVEIAEGRDAVLELTANNAEVTAVTSPTTPSATSPGTDPSWLLSRWQDSVVWLWTPTSRALGFVIDARGLVVANQRTIGSATSVEVQLAPTVKVAARVLAGDATRDVAVIWIDPAVVAAVRPVPLDCQRPARSVVVDGQEVYTIDAPARAPKVLASGTVSRVETRAVLADFRPAPRTGGGPVFAADGGVVGITAPPDEHDEVARGEWRVASVDAACQVVGAAEVPMRDAAPPSGTLLPVEPPRPFPREALEDAAQRRGGAGPYQMSSPDFDVAFITPVLIYAARHGWRPAGGVEQAGDVRAADVTQERRRLLTDFGAWSEYVADIPPVLLVRVTPRLVEGFWTKVGRGAAYTQGVSLPPLKRFKPGFSRMMAFCGTAGVAPIHAFTLERRVSESDAIREGLYVFDPGALGPACGTVKLVLFSEKAPDKGETRAVDPGVLEQVWRDFAPWRAP
jgi:hypothetical protein